LAATMDPRAADWRGQQRTSAREAAKGMRQGQIRLCLGQGGQRLRALRALQQRNRVGVSPHSRHSRRESSLIGNLKRETAPAWGGGNRTKEGSWRPRSQPMEDLLWALVIRCHGPPKVQAMSCDQSPNPQGFTGLDCYTVACADIAFRPEGHQKCCRGMLRTALGRFDPGATLAHTQNAWKKQFKWQEIQDWSQERLQ
jgi:hypothetical protein